MANKSLRFPNNTCLDSGGFKAAENMKEIPERMKSTAAIPISLAFLPDEFEETPIATRSVAIVKDNVTNLKTKSTNMLELLTRMLLIPNRENTDITAITEFSTNIRWKFILDDATIDINPKNVKKIGIYIQLVTCSNNYTNIVAQNFSQQFSF